MKAHEVNFDGIVGPTHNYAGLSFGNLASQKHERSVSHPREAALQGLAKMKYLADLGLKQAVLPPQARPDFPTLRRLGFGGSDADVLAKVTREDPRLLAAAYSASSMWAANAATSSPSADSTDGRVHFTPANLVTQFHRSIETPATAAILKAIFPDESTFAHHPPLPAASYFSDEGAANHTRLCEQYGSAGVELFVYGRDASNSAHNPTVFPARQTRQASSAIGRLHLLDPRFTTFVQQNPNAIDAGVFHNDVVSVGNGNVLLYHASAYAESPAVMEDIRQKFTGRSSVPLHLIEISEEQVPLKDAIGTYLFNSQLVTLPAGGMSLIAPVECRENEGVERVVRQIIAADNPIQSVHYLDVRQSMKNGGGPACLRLRVVLTERELSLVHPGVFFTDSLYGKLVAWVSRHYRETLRPEDLADPTLANESRSAMNELSGILGLEGIYAFQN
jgi:succinylarginine dihydrolase